jgi:hypothetical protein
VTSSLKWTRDRSEEKEEKEKGQKHGKVLFKVSVID